MQEEIAKNYDVVVIGTGFVESLVASASARIGKKVLHIDRNSYYGGKWASFSLNNFEQWISDPSNPNDGESGSSIEGNFSRSGLEIDVSSYQVEENEELVVLKDPNATYCNAKQVWHLRDDVQPTNIKESKYSTRTELTSLNRKFNIDLAPKVLFSKGKLVELLISSNVSRYVEFKCITRIITWMPQEDDGKKLVVVPCSRSDVFSTDVVSLAEKRILMKFLEFCYSFDKNEDQWKDFKDEPFKKFLQMQKLTPKLIHFVTSDIAMVDVSVSCQEGLEKTFMFLNSLGRYGNTPFLFSLYGSGEMPQAFCRLCAVFEGVYMLNSSVGAIVLEKNMVTAIITTNERFNLKHLVMDASYALSISGKEKNSNSISRGVLITNKSMLFSKKEQVSVLRFCSEKSNATPITVHELGPGTGVCPPDTYLVHLTCSGTDAENDLKEAINNIFNVESSESPRILYEAYFNQDVLTSIEMEKSHPRNLHLCSGPDTSLDYNSAIENAREIFKKIFPEEDFLPHAPDPDEIAIDDDGMQPKSDICEKKESTEKT